MINITIRHATSKDLIDIYNIDAKAFKGKGYPEFFIRQAFDVCNDFFLIAESSKKEIVGYVLGVVKNNSTTAWVLSLAVNPIYFSQGIGKILMKELLKVFKKSKVETILLTIDPNNEHAFNLYLKLGFITSNFSENYFGLKEARIIMQKDIRLKMQPFNKQLKNLKTYDAGKPIELVVREFGIDEKDVIKLASNENPYGVSPKVQQVVSDNIHKMYLYPDDSMYELKNRLADRFEVTSQNIIIGIGSDQIIDFISRAILNENAKILTTSASFAMYDICAKACEATIVKTPSYQHKVDEILEAYNREKPNIVYLCTPNNPTGDAITKEDAITIIESIDRDTPIVVDGAYMEYAKFKDTKYAIEPKELLPYPNVIYLGTFSKAYGLAGMRVGYGIGDINFINELYKVRPPFNISTLSMIAGVEALQDEAFVVNSIARNFEEMMRYETFAQENHIEYIDSCTNFITYQFDKLNSTEISDKLLRKGIIVRDLMPSYQMNAIRITMGKTEQNSRFFEAFSQLLKIVRN
jgi:histidinol-phosphate aminotransferase